MTPHPGTAGSFADRGLTCGFGGFPHGDRRPRGWQSCRPAGTIHLVRASRRGRHVHRAARVVIFGFAGLMVFQLVLAAGAPLGHAAWGGDQTHLTNAQRIGSVGSVVFYLLAIACVRGRAGGRTERRYRWGTWALAALMALSAVMNL